MPQPHPLYIVSRTAIVELPQRKKRHRILQYVVHSDSGPVTELRRGLQRGGEPVGTFLKIHDQLIPALILARVRPGLEYQLEPRRGRTERPRG